MEAQLALPLVPRTGRLTGFYLALKPLQWHETPLAPCQQGYE